MKFAKVLMTTVAVITAGMFVTGCGDKKSNKQYWYCNSK